MRTLAQAQPQNQQGEPAPARTAHSPTTGSKAPPHRRWPLPFSPRLPRPAPPRRSPGAPRAQAFPKRRRSASQRLRPFPTTTFSTGWTAPWTVVSARTPDISSAPTATHFPLYLRKQDRSLSPEVAARCLLRHTSATPPVPPHTSATRLRSLYRTGWPRCSRETGIHR